MGYYYRPPHAMPSVAAPLAAAQRFDLSKVDFIVGGSLLYALATGDFGGKDFTVQKWHGAVIIRPYSPTPKFVDLRGRGFEIQRLVTGRRMNDTHMDKVSMEHLQVLRLGPYNVLFVAQVDAVSKHGPHGRRTEVQTAPAPNWRQIVFQMLAKGSTSLLHGIITAGKSLGRRGKVRNAMYLNRIDEYDLRELIQWSTTHVERERLASSIIDGLGVIRERVLKISAGELGIFRMNGTTFYRSERPELTWAHSPKLQPLEDMGRSLLPEEAVLRELFPTGFDSYTSASVPG